MKVRFLNNVFSSDYGIFKIGDEIEVDVDFYNRFKGDIELIEDIKEVKEKKDKMQKKNLSKEV